MNKKRFYFIISSIVIIILSIISIMNADTAREAMLEMVSKVPGAFGERMAKVYRNNDIIIIPNVISIVISSVILAIAIFEKIGVFRNVVIGLCIALLISSGNTFVSVLSIVSIIVSAGIKKEIVKKEKKEKKDMIVLDRFSSGKKGILGAVLCFAVYFSQVFIPNLNSYVLSFIIYLVILFILLFVFKDNLERDLSAFKKGYKEYFSFILPRLGIMYIIYFVISLLCVVINKNMPVNQQQIEALPMWYTFPLAAFLAPIVEEILFRGCIRRFIKNDILFIVVSGLLFGLLHTISEGSILGALFMAIPYSVLGCGFAYIYAKTNNITNNILCHACHNTVVMLLQIILL